MTFERLSSKRNEARDASLPGPSVIRATNEGLVRWLQETGRRRHSRLKRETSAANNTIDQPLERVKGAVGSLQAARRPLLLALLALAYLQYFFAGVSLQIMSLHSFIVFVFTQGTV